MENQQTGQTTKTPIAEEDSTLRRARQLSARKSLKPFSMKEMLASVPDDWESGEADVDDFLGSIRGRDGDR